MANPIGGKATGLPLIKEVRAYTKNNSEILKQGADCHDVPVGHWIDGSLPHPPIANPMSLHGLYAESRGSYGIQALGTLVVEIEAEDGSKGVGVTIGGEPGCYLAEKHLSRFIEGQDPSAVELIWDQMFKATLNYGRKGLPLQVISAVDLALWDLLGHIRNEPVYQMIGGKTKPYLPVYSTSCSAAATEKLGFVGVKLPCPYGPSAGDEGFKRNVDFFKKQRDTVSPDFPIMLDCYMALSLPYATRLAIALSQYNIKWIEECLHPDDYDGYRQLTKACRPLGVMVTTGEHEYSRYGFQQLLDSPGACDIIQPDITWMGGITEARKVVDMASARDVPVIPHGSSIYSYHLQYAFINSPIAEFINLSPNGDEIIPYFGGIFPDEPLPENGKIMLDPSKPGFGVTLDKMGLVRPYTRSEDEVNFQFKKNKEYFSNAADGKAFLPF